MFSKYLFCIMIVLSIFSAASSASAQEGDLPETASTSGAIIETDLESGEDSGNDTAPAELLPEEIVAVVNETSAAEGCSMTILPAVEDIYLDATEEMVYNDDHLVCEYVKGYGYEKDEFPGMVMVQFNISDIELQEDDVAVLVLKAESVERVGKEMAAVGFIPMTSEWTENSSIDVMALNLVSVIPTISDFIQIGMNLGSDEIFAFDVSEHLKAAEDDRISFLLIAVGDTDYKVSFKSRETGEGPALLIMPYPTVPVA